VVLPLGIGGFGGFFAEPGRNGLIVCIQEGIVGSGRLLFDFIGNVPGQGDNIEVIDVIIASEGQIIKNLIPPGSPIIDKPGPIDFVIVLGFCIEWSGPVSCAGLCKEVEAIRSLIETQTDTVVVW